MPPLVNWWYNSPLLPKLDWAAASQHCGLIEQNIRFLKEKIRSRCHSLLFEWVPGIMVLCMVLHIVKFVNRFPQWGVCEALLSWKIMTDCCVNANDLKLSFGVYCQVAENAEPKALLQGQELQHPWTTQATCLVARCSLHWTLDTLSLDTSGVCSLCHPL